MNQQPPKSAQEIIKLKRPRSVAVYDDYVDAAHAVDYLADRQFPVATLAIVGTDLKSVERVTGSMTWGKVLLSGFLPFSSHIPLYIFPHQRHSPDGHPKAPHNAGAS